MIIYKILSLTLQLFCLLYHNRAHLKAKSKVLLDPLDYDDFADLLAGKDIEPKGTQANNIMHSSYILVYYCSSSI